MRTVFSVLVASDMSQRILINILIFSILNFSILKQVMKESALLQLLEGKYTHEILKGQVEIYQEMRMKGVASLLQANNPCIQRITFRLLGEWLRRPHA